MNEKERRRIALGSYAAMPEDRRKQFRERTREATQELCADQGLELTPELVFRVRLSVLDVGAAQDVEAVASEHLAAEETERIVAELRSTTA
jgi:hypothetical protein